MSPVREPKYHSFSYTGKFPSIKMKRMIAFESSVEKDLIYLLDYFAHITEFEEQPLRIYYDFQGKQFFYTPDFRAVSYGMTWLYECKPEKYVHKEDNQRKFRAADLWCQERGWVFKVITPEEIRSGFRLKNVKKLTTYARHEFPPQILAKVLSTISDLKQGAQMLEITQKIKEYPALTVYSAMLHLAYHHRLSLPIDTENISQYSVIRLAE